MKPKSVEEIVQTLTQISVANLWTNFAGMVLSPDAPLIQREEMRKAFYSGFSTCFKVTDALASGRPELEAGAVLDRLNAEADEFFVQLAKEHL